MSAHAEVLNSWKEISNYVGRGVRTVQRWEKDFGLPIRRPSGHLKGSVFAVRTEVDNWLVKCSARRMDAADGAPQPALAGVSHEGIAKVHRNTAAINEKCDLLLRRARELEMHLRRTQELRDRLRACLAS